MNIQRRVFVLKYKHKNQILKIGNLEKPLTAIVQKMFTMLVVCPFSILVFYLRLNTLFTRVHLFKELLV